jgi:hypothetical protein
MSRQKVSGEHLWLIETTMAGIHHHTTKERASMHYSTSQRRLAEHTEPGRQRQEQDHDTLLEARASSGLDEESS